MGSALIHRFQGIQPAGWPRELDVCRVCNLPFAANPLHEFEPREEHSPAVRRLLEGAMEAEERFELDELERFADNLRRQQPPTTGEDRMSQKTLLVREDRELLTKLTVEERAEKGRELALILEDMRSEEEAQSALRHEAKARMAEITARLDALRSLVVTGEERRTVSVEDWAFHELGVVRSQRADSGEFFHERAMTQEERQLPIDFVGPPPADSAEGAHGE